MRKLVFFIIALMALFSMIRAFATLNKQNTKSEISEILQEEF